MSEKYTKIYSLPSNLYTESSPVVIKAGALLKNNTSGRLIAQLKFCNIQKCHIKLLKVELQCQDSIGRALDEVITFDYLDLDVARGVDFGSKSPIYLKNEETRYFSVRVTEVAFVDNTVWTNTTGVWDTLGEQESIETVIADEVDLLAYKHTFGEGANLKILESQNFWFCTCGAINHSDEEECFHCGHALTVLKSPNLYELKKKHMYDNAMAFYNQNERQSLEKAQSLFEALDGYLDSATLAEECKKKMQEIQNTKASKRKKIFLWSGISFAAVIVIALLGHFVIHPFSSLASGDYATYIKMYGIEEFEVPEGTTYISNYAFSHCDTLTSITIPDSVTSIGGSAFYGCSSLTSVTIPDSVTRIGSYSFEDCSSLTSITIPSNVTKIGNGAFSDCYALETIYFNAIAMDDFSNVVLYSSLCFYEAGKNATGSKVIIGANVKKIPAYMFASSAFKIVEFEEGSICESIGNSAFSGCDSLTSITIPDSVTSIGEDAFYECSSLTSITIPDSVTNIGDWAFFDCDSLTSITIPDSVTNIGDWAFRWCSDLTSITIPDSVTSIGDGAFSGCSNLTIYCEAKSKPSGWSYSWNPGDCPVVWGY